MSTLSAIDLSLEPGECVALMGASGCGKSTLFGIVAGFLRPSAGRVLLDGCDITDLPPEKRGLGLVPQNYALFPAMTVRANVAYPLRLRGMGRREAATAAQAALTAVGLEGFADRLPGALSGGQRQRVALARATVFAPPALLLDEPLSALDPHLRRELRSELRRLQRETRAAAFIVTHDAEEAFALADRVAVMEAGQIVQLDTPDRIYAAPATLATARLTGTVNCLPGTVGADGSLETNWGRLAVRTPRPNFSGRPRLALIRPERIERRPAELAAEAFEILVQVTCRDSRWQGDTVVHDLIADGVALQLIDRDPSAPTMVAIPADAIVLVPGP